MKEKILFHIDERPILENDKSDPYVQEDYYA